LASVPRNPDKKQKQPRKSRAEQIINNGGTPLLPDVGEAFYLVNYWRQVGAVGSSESGPVALSYQEIESWQRQAGLPLEPWETIALRQMSEAYVSQWFDSQEPEATAPYGGASDMIDRQKIGSKIGRILSSNAKKG